jgi:Uma2 family endonuclease
VEYSVSIVGGSDQPKEETVSRTALAPEYTTGTDLRDLADLLLETTRVEYVDEGVLLVMNPPATEHRAIVRLIGREIDRAYVRGQIEIEWIIDSENFQWDLPDGSGRFYVPDIVVSHPAGQTGGEQRSAIALVVEVTSPASADTVYNDRVIKPTQYAKGGIPLYLLIDQERNSWSLHGLGDKPGYQVLAAGKYGESVPLPAPFGFSIPTTEWPQHDG